METNNYNIFQRSYWVHLYESDSNYIKRIEILKKRKKEKKTLKTFIIFPKVQEL